MSFEAFNWNVIVRGAWNRAILTPAWIATNLFQLPEGSGIAVEVPLNERAPWRVKHEGIAVLAGPGSLEIVTETCVYELLDRARQCARRAIEELPRTPLSAAGFNIRYRCSEQLPQLASAIRCRLDAVLSEFDFGIEEWGTERSLRYGDGLINVDLRLREKEGAILSYNFHRAATDPEELRAWLETPIADVQKHVDALLKALPGVTL